MAFVLSHNVKYSSSSRGSYSRCHASLLFVPAGDRLQSVDVGRRVTPASRDRPALVRMPTSILIPTQSAPRDGCSGHGVESDPHINHRTRGSCFVRCRLCKDRKIVTILYGDHTQDDKVARACSGLHSHSACDGGSGMRLRYEYYHARHALCDQVWDYIELI